VEPHNNFLLGRSEVEEGSSTPTGEGLATGSAEKESGFASASSSIGSIGDHIAETLLAITFTFGIGTGNIQIFRLWTTSLLRSLSHPLLLSKERITEIEYIINILKGHDQFFCVVAIQTLQGVGGR
jgi:hypothetical protein